MRVLYVNHTSQVSGAERSLLTLLEHLPDDVDATLACPPGPLAVRAAALGVGVETIRGTEVSFRLSRHTPRGLAAAVGDAFAIRRLARRRAIDLVHANSIRAGLLAAPLRWLGGPPVLVSVRDCLPRGAPAALVRRAICATASGLAANSRYTRNAFVSTRCRAVAHVVHSPVDLGAFDPARYDRSRERRALGLEPADAVIALAAQITPWKGQAEAIEALALVREEIPSSVLLLVGEAKFVAASTRFDNSAYLASLQALVRDLHLSAAVRFLGEREDVPRILAAADVLIAPSWEEPFGRSVVEAMAMGLPVVVTGEGGHAEVVEDRATGLHVPPRDPAGLAEAIVALLKDDGLRREIGLRARERSRAFDAVAHSRSTLSLYRGLLRGSDLEPARARGSSVRPRGVRPPSR